MKITRRQLRQIIKEAIHESYRDPTARHQSELSFAQTNPPESKKALQQQYWSQHRGPSARREIESQLSSMSEEEQDEAISFLIPDDPVTGQPGHEVWASLAMKEADWDLHKGATGSRVPTRREAYLSDLAWDVAYDDVEMGDEDIEKLSQVSPWFRDTYRSANLQRTADYAREEF